MRLGIIGTSGVAEAMIKIFLKNRVVSGSDVTVYDTDDDILNYWAGTYDVIPSPNLDGALENAQIIFIAAEGNSLPKLISNLGFLLKTYRPLVVSLTRGRTMEELEDLIDLITPMARIMTNLNIEVGSGITAYSFNELVTDDQKLTLVEMFSATGALVEIDEAYFDCFSAISSLTSTFMCSLIETLTMCAIDGGLSKKIAIETVIKSIYGTAKLLTDTGAGIGTMLSNLCPPESMTTDALLALKENGFDKAVISGYKISKTNKY